jgi:hypothetical protein
MIHGPEPSAKLNSLGPGQVGVEQLTRENDDLPRPLLSKRLAALYQVQELDPN